MIHEIDPYILDNAYKNVDITEQSRLVLLKNKNLLVKETAEGIEYPLYAEAKELTKCYTYLFSLDGQSYFLGEIKEGQAETLIQKLSLNPISAGLLKESRPVHLAYAGMTALHLCQWYKNSTYCGQCGSKTTHHPKIRMMQCPNCGNMIFPRISPCIICAVTDGEKLLVTEHAPGSGYALVAGFIEIGETAEECCAREVYEETGVHIKDIQYYGSQPWGCDGNMMFGYTAHLDGSPAITVDRSELAAAKWKTPEEIPEPQDQSSLTREMIRRYRHHTLFKE